MKTIKIKSHMTKANINKPSFVKLIEPNMKAGGKNPLDMSDRYVQAHKFPEGPICIVRKQVYTISPLHYSITYLNAKGVSFDTIVSAKLEVKTCTKKEKESLKEACEAYQLKNINLYKPSWNIGSDPEIFVEDKEGNIIPSFLFLPSKKDAKPHAAYGETMYWDGFQGEFSTRASPCLAWQVDSVQYGLQAMLNKAREFNKDAKLSTKTVMDISQELRETSKDEHVEFGCMPSLNVYGTEGLKISGREMQYRSAGGHIHFGIGKRTKKEIKNIVKTLDAILGVACVSLFQNYDDPRRRTAYGLAGEYRLPPHGLEYRTLSNAWMFHPMIQHLVFDMSRRIVVFAEQELLKFWKGNEKETVDCINTCDVAKAQEILERNKALFKRIIQQCYGRDDIANEFLFQAFYNGMDSVIKDTSNFEKNWNINNWINHSDGPEKNVGSALESICAKKKIA